MSFLLSLFLHDACIIAQINQGKLKSASIWKAKEIKRVNVHANNTTTLYN
jgi:hypothetical protein